MRPIRPKHVGQGRHYLLAVLAVGGSVAISALLEHWLPASVPSFSLVFLLSVLAVAAHTALGPALATAVLGFLAFNYFFTEPRYTFVITRPDELVAATLFLVTGLIGGNLADRLRRQVAALHTTNEQSRRLLMLHERLSTASTPEAVHTAASDVIRELTGVATCSLVAEESTRLQVAACAPRNTELTSDEWAAARRAVQGGADNETGTSAQGPWHFAALRVGDAVHGVLGVRLGGSAHTPTEEELQLLEAYATQIAQALTRVQLMQRLEEARVAQETERLRSALLSSVSHDLRTPLSSIIGAASSLRDLSDRLSAEDRQELLDGLLAESQRLDRYIGNLLDMTRLAQGTLPLQRDWTAPADLVGSALRRMRERFPNLPIERSVPADLPLLNVHAALVEQALVNVMENAARFTPAGAAMGISAGVDSAEGHVVIEIADQGPGIPESDREHVFEMFYRGRTAGGDRPGGGLGLAISHGVAAAHGGSISAHPGPGGVGTLIRLRFPIAPAPIPQEEPV